MSLPLKIGLGIGGVIALGALGLQVNTLRHQRDGLQLLVNRHAECVGSIQLAAMADRPSTTCDPIVAAAVVGVQQALDCDNALTVGQAFRIGTACSTPVKTVVADRDTARIERDGLAGDLARYRADQAAALGRAAARAKTQAHKETIAHAALDDAPVDGAGLTVCSDDCLRRLSGEATGPAGSRPTR